jgi:hypothetical protein
VCERPGPATPPFGIDGPRDTARAGLPGRLRRPPAHRQSRTVRGPHFGVCQQRLRANPSEWKTPKSIGVTLHGTPGGGRGVLDSGLNGVAGHVQTQCQ